MGGFESLFAIVLLVVALFVVSSFVRILREYERAVIFRLGRSARAILNPGGQGNGPGLVLLVPLIDRMVKVSLQTVALDVPPQDVITRDNVSIKVSAVIYFRVIDPEKAVVAVQDYLYATSQIAQTTLRSVLGQVELDDLLSARDKINQQLQRIIDEHTEPWGIKVATVRRLTFTILSTTGMSRMIPGPFAPMRRPSRKMTPRSYSRRILIADERKKSTMTTAGTR